MDSGGAARVRTVKLSVHASRNGLSKKAVVRLFRQKKLPSYVGAVVNGPITVTEWARQNGVSQPTALSLYSQGCLPGVVKGHKPAPRDPWWASPHAQVAMFEQLRKNASGTARLRDDLKQFVRAVTKARPHLEAVRKLQGRIRGIKRRLDNLGLAHKRQTERFCHIRTAIKRSELLLSEVEIARIRKHLNANPARSLAMKRWSKERQSVQTNITEQISLNGTNGNAADRQIQGELG